jgi:hypothetical protein
MFGNGGVGERLVEVVPARNAWRLGGVEQERLARFPV